jgi:hypothetical protein
MRRKDRASAMWARRIWERIEGRSIGMPAAIFHKILTGYPLTPKDPEVRLTPDELAARISSRNSAGREIEEEEKAETELDR